MNSKGPIITLPASAFNAIYLPFLAAGQRHQLFFGGAGSGKSVFLAARALLDCFRGRNTLIVRQTARSLRSSCFQEVLKAMGRFQLSRFFEVNKTQLLITCLPTGSQLLFLGLDDVEKIKSITPQKGSLTDIWVEEATQTNQADVKQLEKRLRGPSPHKKRLTLSFNPVSRAHWIYREYFADFQEDLGRQEGQDLLILRSTHLDNRFLTLDDRAALLGECDPYFHQVYTLGHWGTQGGAVFTSWKVGQLLQTPDRSTLRCGLDFGYAGDPAAAVLAAYDSKRRQLYILDEFCEKGLLNDQLAQKLLRLAPGLPVVCDSAEPKSIQELRRHGVMAYPARKGPDSVRHGLQWLGQQQIILHPACTRLREELISYRWQQDNQGGYLPRPVGEDHLIDALRYAMESDSQQRGALVLRR